MSGAAPTIPAGPAPKALEYDATLNKGRRKAPGSSVTAEHVVLPQSKRIKMLATAQDQIRNASVAAWMLRHHLDYVSRFRFQFKTGKEELDKVVNRLFDWHAQPRNFDIAGRLGREEGFRLLEGEKAAAGDAGFLKLAIGKLQAIESDMLAFPKIGPMGDRKGRYDSIPRSVTDKVDRDTGVILSLKYPGLVEKWCICNRGWDGKQTCFDHLEPAGNLIFDAYYTRFASQIRGVSPLSTALNSMQDLYEALEWNLLKAKVHAIFGLAIMRDYAGATSDQEEVSALGAAAGIVTGASEQLAAGNSSAGATGTKSVSASLQALTPNSTMIIDMETRGRVETIESKTPSTEFQAFTELITRVILLSLDIPFSAYNSAASSFAGMIADNNLYEVSCRPKREKNKWKRREYSDWLLALEWNKGKDSEWSIKDVCQRNGISRLRELQEQIEWISSGAPWLQKLQEVQGDIKAIACGLDNHIDICQRRGGDIFANIDKIAQVQEYAKKKGVVIMIGESGQMTVDEAAAAGETTPEKDGAK